ncbi:thioesterase family protein, partial [Candidatus Sumerlaeota bacterium]|nr:thioesterase family protein [Candidatus Sumerlaeota bacterium]
MMTPSASDPGWPCVSACALPEWIDDMGHVNMQQYFRLAAQGVFGMTLKILCGGRTPEPPPLVFTLEADMQYRSEILSGQEIEVYMLPISRGGKVMRSMIRIYKMTPQPALAAECDWTGAYINRETRKIDPLPPLAMEIWDRKVGELGAALPDPDAAPRRKGFSPAAPSEDHGRRTLEGQIEAGWIDRMGHMGIEHYALIFE